MIYSIPLALWLLFYPTVEIETDCRDLTTDMEITLCTGDVDPADPVTE